MLPRHKFISLQATDLLLGRARDLGLLGDSNRYLLTVTFQLMKATEYEFGSLL